MAAQLRDHLSPYLHNQYFRFYVRCPPVQHFKPQILQVMAPIVPQEPYESDPHQLGPNRCEHTVNRLPCDFVCAIDALLQLLTIALQNVELF